MRIKIIPWDGTFAEAILEDCSIGYETGCADAAGTVRFELRECVVETVSVSCAKDDGYDYDDEYSFAPGKYCIGAEIDGKHCVISIPPEYMNPRDDMYVFRENPFFGEKDAVRAVEFDDSSASIKELVDHPDWLVKEIIRVLCREIAPQLWAEVCRYVKGASKFSYDSSSWEGVRRHTIEEGFLVEDD